MINGINGWWTTGREAPDAWSPYHVAGHMLHIDESDWIDRTQVILAHGASREFEPVDREALETLVAVGDLAREGLHPDFGPATLSQLLARWVVHDLNHLDQIVKTMAKQYSDAIGPWRAFLPMVDAL